MKTANDITKAYNEAYRKDNDLIFFLLGGTVSNFLEEQYKKAKEGYQTFPYEMSYEAFGSANCQKNFSESRIRCYLLHHSCNWSPVLEKARSKNGKNYH